MAGIFNKARRSVLFGASALAAFLAKTSSGSTMPSLMPTGKQQYFYPGSTSPLAGGQLYTYAAGTSAPKATYQDAAGTIANTNPIALDSTGSALIYWTGNYKVVLKDALGNTVYTVDNYNTDLAAGLQSQFGAANGSSLIGFQQAGTGATVRTAQDKLREAQVSSIDFSGLVFTATAKSQTDANSHTAASFQSWRKAIQAALDTVSSRGGGTVLIPYSSTPYLIDDALNIKANTRVVFEGTVKLADYTTVGAMVVVNGNNIVIDNPLLDGSSIYAGGSGQNGIGIVSGNHIRVNGGHIQNCACGSSNGDGGKAVQIEAGAGEDIVVAGTALSNSFIAMSTIRDGGTASPYHGIMFSTIKADNCSILFLVKQTNINDVTGLQHTVQLDNFFAVNCGAFEGVMQFSRASNVLVSNGMVVNDPAVAATSLIRGNHRYCRFANIIWSSTTDSAVNLDPSTYCPDNSYAPTGNVYDIQHMGTLNFLINSTSTVDMNSTGKFQLQNDVNAAFFGYPLRNGNSTFHVEQGGKTAIVGTNTNFNTSGGVIKFAQLPLNFSVPVMGANNIMFPAVQAPSTDPNTLDDYEEGTWTPTDNSGAALAFVTAYGNYTKIGRMVFAACRVTYPATTTTANAAITGLPYNSRAGGGQVTNGSSLRYTDYGSPFSAANNPGSNGFGFFGMTGTALANSTFAGKTVDMLITYMAET